MGPHQSYAFYAMQYAIFLIELRYSGYAFEIAVFAHESLRPFPLVHFVAISTPPAP